MKKITHVLIDKENELVWAIGHDYESMIDNAVLTSEFFDNDGFRLTEKHDIEKQILESDDWVILETWREKDLAKISDITDGKPWLLDNRDLLV